MLDKEVYPTIQNVAVLIHTIKKHLKLSTQIETKLNVFEKTNL